MKHALLITYTTLALLAGCQGHKSTSSGADAPPKSSSTSKSAAAASIEPVVQSPPPTAPSEPPAPAPEPDRLNPSLPDAPSGKTWVKIGRYLVPAGTGRTMPGQESRFSENLKWPNTDRDSIVVYLGVNLTDEEAKAYGPFTVMEDKPAGCDSGADQPRTPAFRLGQQVAEGGVRCAGHPRGGGHYLARLNGAKPDREHEIEVWELR